MQKLTAPLRDQCLRLCCLIRANAPALEVNAQMVQFALWFYVLYLLYLVDKSKWWFYLHGGSPELQCVRLVFLSYNDIPADTEIEVVLKSAEREQENNVQT